MLKFDTGLISLADKNGMHDFLLAKEIIGEVLKIAKAKMSELGVEGKSAAGKFMGAHHQR